MARVTRSLVTLLNNMEDKKQEEKKEKKRQIIIEFTAESIKVIKAEVASNFELQAILENLLNQIKPK